MHTRPHHRESIHLNMEGKCACIPYQCQQYILIKNRFRMLDACEMFVPFCAACLHRKLSAAAYN